MKETKQIIKNTSPHGVIQDGSIEMNQEDKEIYMFLRGGFGAKWEKKLKIEENRVHFSGSMNSDERIRRPLSSMLDDATSCEGYAGRKLHTGNSSMQFDEEWGLKDPCLLCENHVYFMLDQAL